MRRNWRFSPRDAGVTLLALVAAAALSALFTRLDPAGKSYAPMLFLFAVALVSRLTSGYFYGVAAAVISVFAINFAFTAPYMAFNFSLAGYPLTFLTLLVMALLISAMTTQLKRQEERNYRARVEEMRANLLRAVSHDLRTPLTSISAAASLLAEDDGTLGAPRRREMLLQISDDAQWLIRMVENLLSITRVSDGPSGVRKTPEAAEEVVSEAVRKYRARFARPAAQIDLPNELVMVPMDAILIGQVLSNLLENAALHAQGATRVRVRLRVEGAWAVFEVTDDGAGIPPARLATLFDPSAAQPSDSAAHPRNNMGIGLSVCRTIVMAHGGALEAENLPDGACFRFRLPMEKEEKHA
ncbi:MAG TPA: DUF4118 domain-containing protein [Candidatus Pullichristensenella avicola]|nr:DUF4118 domain-containing protein [Candidatus Pullichristensenella avicola]